MTLKDIRNDLKLTQVELAEILKCTQKKINHIEKGRSQLQIHDIRKLILALNLTGNQIKKLVLDSNEKD